MYKNEIRKKNYLPVKMFTGSFLPFTGCRTFTPLTALVNGFVQG